MSYHKWILKREEVNKLWSEKYLKTIGIPIKILDIPNISLREKLVDMWKVIYVNFGEEIDKGIESKTIRTLIYKFITQNYYEDMNDMNEVLKWLSKNNLLNLYSSTIEEEFIKAPIKEARDGSN